MICKIYLNKNMNRYVVRFVYILQIFNIIIRVVDDYHFEIIHPYPAYMKMMKIRSNTLYNNWGYKRYKNNYYAPYILKIKI